MMRYIHEIKSSKSAGLLLLALIVSASASADQMNLKYDFEYPELSKVTLRNVTYDQVVLEGAPNCGNAGQPLLPARGAEILLPYGHRVERIEITPGERIKLGGGFNVEPASVPVSLSSVPDAPVLPVPDQTIYSSDRPFPEELFEVVGTHGFRGYQILILRIRPIQYLPATGELFYYPDLTVVVRTVVSPRPTPLFRGSIADETEVVSRVDNPVIVGTYTAAGIRDPKGYDLLIITTPDLAGSFQPLKDYHDTAGIITEIRTTADIGNNDPDDIRDYIRNRYLNDGIQYVLIGADDDLIPAKDLYVRTSEDEIAEIEYNMPADLYFGCLDGTFNFNGNTYWGEPEDGEGGGDVDLIAEVCVGRASVGDITEADRFVSKTLQYLSSQESYLREVLLVGEHLGFGGVSEYGGTILDELVDGIGTHGYSTKGIPSSVYTIDKLYDRDWENNNWPVTEVVDRMNGGIHAINHLGHGGPDQAMKLYSDQILSDVINEDHCVIYSQACFAGQFDDYDCWAEYMNSKSDYGAFALLVNAREGWGKHNSTDGASQRFNREFWDAVFSPAEDKLEIGRANHDSKEDNLYCIDQDCMRWCYYGLNLLGDPTVRFKILHGIEFDYPNGIPVIVAPGESAIIEVNVTGTYGGSPVSGTGQLHYSIDGAEFVTGEMNEISTDQYEAVLPSLDYGMTIEFYFTVDEATSGTFSDPKNAPNETYSAFQATDSGVIFVDSFEDDMGWSVSGDATDGQWERGSPAGSGDAGDPVSDFDGSGNCYLTDNVEGDSDVDDGTTSLISPTIDLSIGDATVHYARWYSNSAGANPNDDVFMVYISNDDGETWSTVETVGPVDESSGSWYEHTFRVSDFVMPSSQMRLRFDASDLNEASVIEAGVDAVSVQLLHFEPYICGNADATDAIDIDDVVFLVEYIFVGGPAPDPIEAGDVDCSNDIDIDDVVYLVVYIFGGGSVPCAACP